MHVGNIPGHPAPFQQQWPGSTYRYLQLGFVVDDVVAHAHRWAQLYGVGPFFTRRVENSPCTYRGRASTVSLDVAVAQAGPVQIELIAQLCDNDSVYTEIARRGASAFHQIGTVTTDHAAALAHYRAQGFDIACEFRFDGAPTVAYVDTLEQFGYFTEVIELAEDYQHHVEAIAEAARSWDSTDPVRAITADGYGTLE